MELFSTVDTIERPDLRWDTMPLVLNKLSFRCLLDIPMEKSKYMDLTLRREDWTEDINVSVIII